MQNQRLDFLIEEAGCLIWVAPRSLGGLTPARLAQVWMGRATQNTGDLVKRSAMMPMSLYQDDGYLVRFILGELSQQEQAEWTARALWKLDITCGEVLISGILTPDFDEEFSAIVSAEANGSYWAGAYIGVPPGVYQVEVYSYPPGDLAGGWGMITNPRTFGKHPGIEPEKAVAYFRRTRPNQEPPAWIEDKEEEGSYIDFIIRLGPLKEDRMQPDMEEDGCIKWEYRKPDICPIGIWSDFAEE
jgi:hypothetical protein